MLIALIGVDGSGKTTLSKVVADELKDNGKKVIIFRPVDYFFLGLLLDFVRFAVGIKKPVNFKENPFLKRGKRPIFFKIWPAIAAVDFIFVYLFRILPLILRFDVVICDRYFYDKLLSFEYYGYSSHLLTRLFFPLIPKPQILICLSCRPEAAKSREKGNIHDLNFYSYLNKRYLEIGGRHALLTIKTDSYSPKEAKKLILRKIKKQLRLF